MVQQQFRYSPNVIKASQVRLLLAVIGALLVSAWLVAVWPCLDEMTWRRAIHDADGSINTNLLALAIVVPIAFIVLVNIYRARISIDDRTLVIYIPRLTGLGLMRLTTGYHCIPLARIRGMMLHPGVGGSQLGHQLRRSQLILKTADSTYRLQPYQFMASGQPDHRVGLRQALNKVKGLKGSFEEILKKTPLVLALEQTLGPAAVDSENQPTIRSRMLAEHYDLKRHKGIVVLLVLMAVCGFYALVDLIQLIDFKILGSLPLGLFALAGIIAAGISIVLSTGAPRNERIGLAAIFAAVAVFACYPGVQRYTLLKSAPPVSVAYHADKTALFTHPDYPTIDLHNNKIPEYWQTVAVGDNYLFKLYVPALGFTLVDMGPVYAKSRAFYQSHPQAGQTQAER